MKARKTFDVEVKRRCEIELLARAKGAADTEDFDTYAVAWVWHNAGSREPAFALIEAARRMGHPGLTKDEAQKLVAAARNMRKCRRADSLARFLHLKFADRQRLRITTIGAIDMTKRKRAERRKRRKYLRDRQRMERKRRAVGAMKRADYEGNSLSRQRPWQTEGISRAQWYRNGKAARERCGNHDQAA